MEAALYLNALAFPALLLIACGLLALLMEASWGHPLANWENLLRRITSFAPLLLVLAVAWWLPHLYFALKIPKPELVDLRNPIACKARALVDPNFRRGTSRMETGGLPGKL